MTTAADIVTHAYRRRLKAAGIAQRPDRRTPERAATAALEFWAAKSEALLDAGSLDQSAAEDN